MLFYIEKSDDFSVGADCDEGPPVPIPNTEVKLISVEDTWRAAARENRTVPTQRKHTEKSVCFSLYPSQRLGM